MNTKMRYTERVHYLYIANNKCAFVFASVFHPGIQQGELEEGIILHIM